jgi:hypothetical protein
MSDMDDATGTDNLDDDFLRRVRALLKRTGLELAVPEEGAKDTESFDAAAGSGCNCPPGERCVRLFPSGKRVCVPR